MSFVGFGDELQAAAQSVEKSRLSSVGGALLGHNKSSCEVYLVKTAFPFLAGGEP